ncbi:MAG: hypothetical protein ACRC62_15665 [Microcoleus sp.]
MRSPFSIQTMPLPPPALTPTALPQPTDVYLCHGHCATGSLVAGILSAVVLLASPPSWERPAAVCEQTGQRCPRSPLEAAPERAAQSHQRQPPIQSAQSTEPAADRWQYAERMQWQSMPSNQTRLHYRQHPKRN